MSMDQIVAGVLAQLRDLPLTGQCPWDDPTVPHMQRPVANDHIMAAADAVAAMHRAQAVQSNSGENGGSDSTQTMN